MGENDCSTTCAGIRLTASRGPARALAWRGPTRACVQPMQARASRLAHHGRANRGAADPTQAEVQPTGPK